MKWYIFNDYGDNYKVVLDHNTTARIKCNDDNKNISCKSNQFNPVVQDLKTAISPHFGICPVIAIPKSIIG